MTDGPAVCGGRGLASARRGGALKGCLIALIVVVFLLLALGAWVAFSWRGWAAGWMEEGTRQMIAQSELPQDQKDRINTKVKSIADEFRAGKLTLEDMGRVLKHIGESPLMQVWMVALAEQQYVGPSSLSAEEKADARLTLQRFVRGSFEKKIKGAEIDQVLDMISTRKPGGGREFKPALSPEELAAFLSLAKQKADAAGVPDEPYQVNIADELEKAIDSALGRGGSGPGATPGGP